MKYIKFYAELRTLYENTIMKIGQKSLSPRTLPWNIPKFNWHVLFLAKNIQIKSMTLNSDN